MSLQLTFFIVELFTNSSDQKFDIDCFEQRFESQHEIQRLQIVTTVQELMKSKCTFFKLKRITQLLLTLKYDHNQSSFSRSDQIFILSLNLHQGASESFSKK